MAIFAPAESLPSPATLMMTIITGDFMTIKLGLSRVLVTTIQRQKSFISQQEVSAKAVSYFEKQRSINS